MSEQAKNAKEWSPQQRQFLEWLALPKTQRKPGTQRALAKEFGVDEATLSDWKRLPGFMDEVNALARELVKHDIADVLGVVRKRARDGELAYVNMVLAMAGMSVDVEAAGKGPAEGYKVYVASGDFDPESA